MGIKQFINKESFIMAIRYFSQELNARQDIINYIQKNNANNLHDFSTSFWENPSQSISKLKNKYNISNSISAYDIIRAHNCDKYLEFLSDCWNFDVSINKIVEKYLIPYNKIESLMLPIFFNLQDSYCPECLASNIYVIDSSIKDVKNDDIDFYCAKCNSKLHDIKELLSKDECEKRLSEIENIKKEFNEYIESIDLKLKNIKCYKCQSPLKICTDDSNYTYKLECTKCGNIIENIETAESKYKDWKKRAAMMITIKAKEQELIEKKLGSKKPTDILIKSEDIIKEEESAQALGHFYEIQNKELLEAWKDVFQIVKSCNRLSKLVLLNILELCKERNFITTWVFKATNDKFDVYRLTFEDEPVVINLYNKIGIVMLRKELRKLIEKGLIAVDEEKNYIDVMPILVDNIEIIRSLLNPQEDINDHIRYLIFERYKFTCQRCGETGRPLKLAYLTLDKNKHDINLMTCLCDNCFEDVTENEILIDGTISFEVYEEKKNSIVSWEFLLENFPILKDDDKVYKDITRLANTYGEINLMKALTITIDKINNNKLVDSKVTTLLKYTSGILKNSEENIDLSETLNKKYNIQDWIKKL